MQEWKKRLIAFAPKEGVLLWICALLILCGEYFLYKFVKLIAPSLSGADLIEATAAGSLAIFGLSMCGVLLYWPLKVWASRPWGGSFEK